MIRYSLTLLAISTLLILTAIPAVRAAEPKLPPKDQFHLFLLVGQSNMAGRGKVTPEDQIENPRVLMLNKKGNWVPAVDPMHFDKPSIVGVGLGRTFGLEIAKAEPGVTIGLIPCAVGGSAIDRWEPGAFDGATKTHPYDDAMQRAHAALESGVLKGILWHQGESDSRPKKADAYQQKLHDLIIRFRKELDAPDVPFVIGQLGQFEERPWNDSKTRVNQAHQTLAKNMPKCVLVSSDGLTHKGDKTHFNAKSYREFGHRYAEAFLKLTEKDEKQ